MGGTLKKTWKASPGKESAQAHYDLEQLRQSPAFRDAILACKGKPGGNVQALCDRFLIGDPEWMSHVIRSWDGEGPLPWTNDSNIWRAQVHKPRKGDFTPLPLGLDKDNFFSRLDGFHGGESEYLSGSPRLQKQSLYQRDISGAEWMTLRIRLAPGLTVDQLKHWMRGALKECQAKSKKPSAESFALALLDEQYGSRKGTLTKYQLAQFLTEKCKPTCKKTCKTHGEAQRRLKEKGFTLSLSTANKRAALWLAKRHP